MQEISKVNGYMYNNHFYETESEAIKAKIKNDLKLFLQNKTEKIDHNFMITNYNVHNLFFRIIMDDLDGFYEAISCAIQSHKEI